MDLIALEEAMYRLLHQRSLRTAFLAGAPLPVSPGDQAALAELDHEQLERAARRIAHEVLRRGQRGSGDLASLFARTLAGRSPAELDELAYQFLESPAFSAYREVPCDPPGLCLEEAFYRFCQAAGVGEPAARDDDFWTGLLKALAISPRPHFATPSGLIARGAAWLAIGGSAAAPILYGAAGGRFIKGELTPFMAELLREGAGAAAAVAARHGVLPAVQATTVRELAGLGLL